MFLTPGASANSLVQDAIAEVEALPDVAPAVDHGAVTKK